MMLSSSNLLKYARLAISLRNYLLNTITLEQSQEVISRRLQNRNNNFLDIVQKGIYRNKNSPYLKLLKAAGCEYPDIEVSVKKQGIEATLCQLRQNGVYFSWEEYKGKTDTIRGSSHFHFEETAFDNPFATDYYRWQSSGSRSAGARTKFDLKDQRERDYYHLVMLAANHALGAPMGTWFPGLPGSSGINHLLRNWSTGKPVARWFVPAVENQVHASFRDRLAIRYILYGGRLWGAKLAKPEYVRLSEAVKVAQWIAATKKKYKSCSFSTFVSLAVMVCQAAKENDIDIADVHFFVDGEPLSLVKRQIIESVGAIVTIRYVSSEVGFIGCSCPEADEADDVHLLHDSTALIQHQRRVECTDIDVDAFLFTTLLPTSPKIMLNVESDDYGIMETRSCSCLLERMGFRTHLYNIRSFAKLTGSGMTVLGTDFIRVLEEVLPQKYGGAPTDYQLLEEEDNKGQTHLSIIISPVVGLIDESEIVKTILYELRKNVHGGKLASGFWSQVNTLGVKRIFPLSSSGKIIPLHLIKRQ